MNSFTKAIELVTKTILGDKPVSVTPKKKRKYKRRSKR
tara:strand:- start:799 stop:912 length:114 start_codon:yes stop_codon:yes gene_type:complete